MLLAVHVDVWIRRNRARDRENSLPLRGGERLWRNTLRDTGEFRDCEPKEQDG